MKTILFCNLSYAFAILKPLADLLEKQGEAYVWYVPSSLKKEFPYQTMPSTHKVSVLKRFKSDAIFVCGNEVPYWLQGVKVQVFHGLAGEKKGHFRIRHYFDLYLTQGSYFTKQFQALEKKHKNFEVLETGWCKLDPLFKTSPEVVSYKEALLKEHNAKHIILYAPTFSPSLTSAQMLKPTIEKLSLSDNILVLIKFHNKMNKESIKSYEKLSSDNIVIVKDNDITKSLQIADVMISDTSSVVYEFLLLDKPVVTLNSTSPNIQWKNVTKENEVYQEVMDILQGEDRFINKRQEVISLYHPYHDGKSAKRVLEATQSYIFRNGVPTKRKLPFLRKLEMINKYAL